MLRLLTVAAANTSEDWCEGRDEQAGGGTARAVKQRARGSRGAHGSRCEVETLE